MESVKFTEQEQQQLKQKQESLEQIKYEIPQKYLEIKYEKPVKKIKVETDVEIFKKSQTYIDYMTFISDLQQSILSKKISITEKNPKFEIIVTYLKELQMLVDQTPPLETKMRFGNTSFKTWYDKQVIATDQLLNKIIPKEIESVKIELRTYLLDSYGSNVRLDYGTGHEMAFAFFLLGLYKLNYFNKSDLESLVRNVFYEYIKTMRKIQLTYMLEPAGSHGVWGLDDYHFLPFLFGASELVDSKEVPIPDNIHTQKLLDEFHQEYMYLECIKFIKKVKTGPFHEHSPMLNDISGAANWGKIMNGMIKMYQAEVLFKFPVVKHIYFGKLIPLE